MSKKVLSGIVERITELTKKTAGSSDFRGKLIKHLRNPTLFVIVTLMNLVTRAITGGKYPALEILIDIVMLHIIVAMLETAWEKYKGK